MKNKIIILFVSFFIGLTSFGQVTASDCADSEAGCDALDNGFPISPSGSGTVDESDGPNGSDVSWPGSNPQGVNSGCMFSGELNSTWISFTALSDGLLEFELGSSGGSGYYDWILWENTDGMACDGILNNTLAPVSCNWNASSAGFTGMANTTPPGGNAGNFQPALNVQAGDNFILCFSNFSGLNGVVVPLEGDNIACSSPFILEPTICEGETTTLEINDLPPNILSYTWSPATNISDVNAGPTVDVWPTDTTLYTVTIESMDSTWTEEVTVNVVHLITPDAGLDDSLCYSTSVGYDLQGIASGTGDITWEMSEGPTGISNAIFQPNNSNINATTLTTGPGSFEYVLHEQDPTNVCPEGTDTLILYYSNETHTTTFTDPSCFGSEDGTIQIQSTGALGAVEYSFNGGLSFTASPDTIGVGSGTYTVISKDNLGCEFTSDVTITDPPAVLLSAGPTPDTTVCENGTATLYATASNGVTFDYHWNHTTDLNSIQFINPISDSTVTVYAENELGCISETLPITVLLHDPITLTITTNDTVCPGYDASHTVEAIGGFQGYNYEWTANGVTYNETLEVINVNPIEQTTYCVTVTDVCESTPRNICTDVIMREVPTPIFTTDTTEGCVPAAIDFTNLTTYNLAETQTDSLRWLVDGVIYDSYDFTHNFENAGDYDVQLEVYTQYGCHNEITANEYISIHSIPEATFYVISNPTTIFNTEVDMINNTQGDNNTYQWYFTSGIPATSTLDAPTVLYPEGIAADYPVMLTVTNEFNCVDTTYDIVHVISDVIIYAPNAFTPDGDQINNVWRVYIDGIDPMDYHLLLFNRWGEVVWESYDPEGSWNGVYAGQNVQDGTYVWRVVTKDASTDKKYEFRGTVSVLK